MTVFRSELEPRFGSEVAAMPGGELARRCFECGTCSGVCPVSQADPGFDPRRILHMIKMGLKERLLRSEALWACSHCDTCAFVCPQNLRFSSVVDVLREMAVREGYVTPGAFEQWGTGPCKAACPAHISIQGFIGAIAKGNYAEGLRLIKDEMPFPAICGRVCPHPCEAKCNRGLEDEPSAIMFLKRFLADWDLRSDAPYHPKKKESKGEKVAIIGAGPAGLTAAYYLAIEGYPVTVFEKFPVLGGMMAVGIPEYRLPRKILNAEMAGVRDLGVEIRLNCEVGRDIGFEELRRAFKAVFIGTGCHRSLRLGIPGEGDFDGVMEGLAFLRDVHLGQSPPRKGRLVVVGGGNAAIDCARVARRMNFGEVVILYRRTREEMPANPWEVEEALEEGIGIQFLTAPVEIQGEDGRVVGVKCIRMRLGEPDQSGRRRPVPVDGTEFTVMTDLIITAIGQTADLSFVSDELPLNVSRLNLIQSDPLTGATSIPGIFAGGDVVTGPMTVVSAVAFGKEAAISIDRYLRGMDVNEARKEDWTGVQYRPEYIESQARELMPRLFLAERKKTFKEIDLGLTEEQARREASRCLRLCGMQKRGSVRTTLQ